MILEIKKYPNPILRKKAKEIKKITPEIKELILNMIETMKANQGIGLAAPQIGELKKIIIVQTQKGNEVFLNPEIIKKSKEKEIGEEGCLSFPGLFLKIKRAKKIIVKAQNIEGKEIIIKAENQIARIFQHEIDHLSGILFIDRQGTFQKLFQRIFEKIFSWLKISNK